MGIGSGLSTNGLVMPDRFPVTHYESVHRVVSTKSKSHNELFEQFAGAWNAISYRYMAMVEHGNGFTRSIAVAENPRSPVERYNQERDLFGFFSNGFSVFEASFYGLFVIGSLLRPQDFPLSTPREQQAVTPTRTSETYVKSFVGDPLLKTFDWLFQNPSYKEWREIRNVLTHRAAPGRRMYLTIGGSEELPDEWKLLNIRLDSTTIGSRSSELEKLLTTLLQAVNHFVETRFV